MAGYRWSTDERSYFVNKYQLFEQVSRNDCDTMRQLVYNIQKCVHKLSIVLHNFFCYTSWSETSGKIEHAAIAWGPTSNFQKIEGNYIGKSFFL